MNGTGGFVNPDKVLVQLDIKEGMKIADFGCGHGYFAIPIARAVGSEGRVYAIDVLAEALEAVRSRAQLENIVNIETSRGNLETPGGSNLGDSSVDMVLLHNVLFQSQKKSDIIKEARRVLKIGGSFEIIDWQEVRASIGPENGWRLAPEEARRLAESEGFIFAKSFDAGEYHFGLLFRQP